MFRYLDIIWSSFKVALQEFRSNKLRTFLSLLGITFGIFCIISVLATIGSMEAAIKGELKAIGNHIIFVQKFPDGADEDYPWWKYVKRPETKYAEMKALQAKIPEATNMAFFMSISGNVEFGDNILTNVNYYGITEKFNTLQTIKIDQGRYFQPNDFDHGANFIVMGYSIAETLFGKPENAVGKVVKLKGDKNAIVIGIISKEGKSILDAWDYDHTILLSYNYMKGIVREENANPFIMVQGNDKISTDELRDELDGAMRSIRKLSPTQDDNFALNDIGFFAKLLDPIISGMNAGGWAIAALSLIVGMFGVANIMFVTVRERTSQIGLKKALGAKRGVILTEFLLESAFLCIIGGLIGLLAVFILTQIFSLLFSFKVFIPADIIALAVGICLFTGVLAGIVPAFMAARMDPVVAIRSK